MDTTTASARRCRHCGADLGPSSSFCSRCGATATSPVEGDDPLLLRLRELYKGEYEIDREIGRGGMAAVFAAFDPALQRRVAIKALLPGIAAERDMGERFLREARTVAALQHPHVVTVYGVRADDATQALAMQFVEGRSLDAALQERSPMPLPVGGLVLAQVAEGLQHAHDRGVVHRDVKPANVLLETDGRAVVSDFGIARREGVSRLTDTGMVVGTWAYMSPEQRNGEDVTAAADQYELGVMAFEVLAGRLPFVGTPSEMLRAHLYESSPSMRSLRPDIPAHVDATVLRMLEKSPAKRYPSLREPIRAFRTLVPDEKATTQLIAGLSLVQKMTTRVLAVPAAVGTAAAPTVRAAQAPAAASGAATAAGTAAAMVPPTQVTSSSATGGARRVWAVAAALVLVSGGAWWWQASRSPRPAAATGAGAGGAAGVTAAAPSAPPAAATSTD
ncbi:MAG: protein kinase, partial [Gemmatimonadetes bacterium]|nr:protein kinase [Gemmatimonadota bacterium]